MIIRLSATKVRTAPDPVIIGGNTKKHSSDQLNPVSWTPASKTAALKASTPDTWTTHRATYPQPGAHFLIEDAVVVLMTPDSRAAGSVSSVLTSILPAGHPDYSNTC